MRKIGITSISLFMIVLLIYSLTPKMSALNIKESDISLTSSVQESEVGKTFQLFLSSTNQEDTKVVVPLSQHVLFEGNGSVQFDEENQQLVIDWPEIKFKTVTVELISRNEGQLITKAYSIRNDETIESASINVHIINNAVIGEDEPDRVISVEEHFDGNENLAGDNNFSMVNEESLDGATQEVETSISASEETEARISVEKETERATLITGNWGSVPWEWEEESATITLYGGDAGTVASSPWRTYRTVEEIVVKDRVRLPSNAAHLFRVGTMEGLPHLEKIVHAGNFDFSEVTNMDYLFTTSRNLSEVDVSTWDTSKVTSMWSIFHSTNIEELDLTSWDTSNVTTMNSMFREAGSLKRLDISSWDMSKVINSSNMFTGASQLSTLMLGEKNNLRASSLPNVPTTDGYAGLWCYEEEDLFFTSEELMNQEDKLLPGKYTWASWGGTVTIHYFDTNGNKLSDSEILTGYVHQKYEGESREILGWSVVETVGNLSGYFTVAEQEISLIYELKKAQILDPLNPEIEITPKKLPELPEELESLRIDFVPNLTFGIQTISVNDNEYYAEALKIKGTDEERPNFIQISNFSPDTKGWSLSFRQEDQFQTIEGEELFGQ